MRRYTSPKCGDCFRFGLTLMHVLFVHHEVRFAVWKVADGFTSLSDNIQETFGLVVVEAMASGLPVVASDWNGYRDLVVPGETGWLVPTCMVRDATQHLTSQ